MKLARIVLHMVAGIFILARLARGIDPRVAKRRIQLWHRKALHQFGIERIVVGELPKGPCMIVSNHLSWIDILMIGSVAQVRFLSKSEVADWPLVGRLATGAGTLYVNRGDRRSAEKALDDIASALAKGDQVVVFPEGTSTRGPMPIKFRSRLIEAARRANVPVVPMALSYHGPGKALASYADDDQFASHMARLSKAPFIRGRVAIGQPISPDQAAAVIARDAQRTVESLLSPVVCPEPAAASKSESFALASTH